MTKPIYTVSMDLFGETIMQPVPEEHREKLMAAFAEANAHGSGDDDDCPICRVLRAAGMTDASCTEGTTRPMEASCPEAVAGPWSGGPNRAERRALRAMERRAARRRPN